MRLIHGLRLGSRRACRGKYRFVQAWGSGSHDVRLKSGSGFPGLFGCYGNFRVRAFARGRKEKRTPTVLPFSGEVGCHPLENAC